VFVKTAERDIGTRYRRRENISLIHLGTETTDSPRQVIEKAFRFFGPDGVGLHMSLRDEAMIYMVGGGGHVQIVACPKNEASGDATTEVDIQSKEWDQEAQQFLTYL
jgi:accessory colonization factor AcfC